MKTPEPEINNWLKRLALTYDLSEKLLKEYYLLFQAHSIPILRRRKRTKDAERIVMVSTHGYWADPPEVDMERLDSVLNIASRRRNKKIFVPSDFRSLHSKRYENVPIDLADIDIILVDLTYSLILKNTSFKVFLESDYKNRLMEIKERNIARDPDQDFNFILKVLEIEHSIIQKLKKKADLVIK